MEMEAPFDGMDDFTDLVEFFPKPLLELEIFSPTSTGVRFFFSIILDIFFSAFFFSRNLFAYFFPLEISLQDIFSQITHNPLKSQMVGLQNPPNICSVDRF